MESVADHLKLTGKNTAEQWENVLRHFEVGANVDEISFVRDMKNLVDVNMNLATDALPLKESEREDVRKILKDPSHYQAKSPFTEARLTEFQTFQLVKKGIIQKTVDTQVSRIRLMKAWLESSKKELSFDSIGEYLDTLKVTDKTKKQHLFAGSSFWKWAMKNDDSFKSSFKNIAPAFEKHEFVVNRTEKRSRDNRKSYKVADVVKIYNAAKAMKNREILTDLILIGAHTGARIEEICQLEIKDIVDDEGVLSFDIDKSKTKAGVRYTPIHPVIKPIIERMMKDSKDGFLIKSPAGNKYGIRSDAYSKQFGRLKTALGYDKFHVFHSFRGTVITQLHRADVPPITIQAIVGHETDTVAFDTYSEGPSPQQKLAAISKVNYGLDLA